jgi:hypothetical protein
MRLGLVKEREYSFEMLVVMSGLTWKVYRAGAFVSKKSYERSLGD